MDMKWIADVHDSIWTAADGTPLGGFAYTYDAAGNRTAKTGDVEGAVAYTRGVGDRLASWTGGAYTYDAAGNVTRIARDGRPTLDLSWNGRYRLVSVSTNGVFAEGYAYDALGRRASTTTWEEGTVRHVYDDNWQVIADLDSNGNVLRSYVWGEGIDRLLAVKVGAKSYAALTDVQGTVWGLADGTDVVARWTYDAWGNVLSGEVSDPALAAFRYRFQGREFSAVTGLTNFRARWYDPGTGRWLSKDPIRLDGGINLYAFCNSGPTLYNDPLGCARVGNRKLRGAGALLLPIALIPGMVLPMRLTNTFPEHRHIFFDDGSNIGWGKEGFFCEDSDSDYTFKATNYDNDVMKKAVQNIKEEWGKRPYNGITHNCQDFVDAVLAEYEKLSH
ncbi:MAG: RHS repeat-associated core domain-containing protein [bacterium]|nr:RHS repeat-associated core domain-containing protein [bacterium]